LEEEETRGPGQIIERREDQDQTEEEGMMDELESRRVGEQEEKTAKRWMSEIRERMMMSKKKR
jgi:hypothetical protein